MRLLSDIAYDIRDAFAPVPDRARPALFWLKTFRALDDHVMAQGTRMTGRECLVEVFKHLPQAGTEAQRKICDEIREILAK